MRHDARCAAQRGKNAGSAALNQPSGNGEDDTCSRYQDDDQRSDQEFSGNHSNVSGEVAVQFGNARLGVSTIKPPGEYRGKSRSSQHDDITDAEMNARGGPSEIL